MEASLRLARANEWVLIFVVAASATVGCARNRQVLKPVPDGSVRVEVLNSTPPPSSSSRIHIRGPFSPARNRVAIGETRPVPRLASARIEGEPQRSEAFADPF
jgi:hypothetical protein